MNSARFELALEQLPSSDWREFEQLASEFLVESYPSIRTTAAAAGDGGRDAYVFTTTDDPEILFQYSTAEDFRAKINSTLERIAETFPGTKVLTYVTSRAIGSKADDVKRDGFRNYGVYVDVRDRSWFVERCVDGAIRANASEEFSKRYVDPLLSARGVQDRVGVALSDADSRVALLHLALTVEDAASAQGFTKASFEALVLAALHDSLPGEALTRGEVQRAVSSYLHAVDQSRIPILVDSALSRLTGKNGRVKHQTTTDSFSLAFRERESVDEKTALFLNGESRLESVIVDVAVLIGALESRDSVLSTKIAADIRAGIDALLMRRGEAFVAAVSGADIQLFDPGHVMDAIAGRDVSNRSELSNEQVAFAVLEVLAHSDSLCNSHLKRLADAYTLFGFLRETPDVQKVIIEVFSDADLWLDTSVILPLIAETLSSDHSNRKYSVLLRAAHEAGLRLFVTPGVVEGVERHLNLCVTFARNTGDWNASTPYVYKAYALSGGARAGFASWASEFRGEFRPEQDVAEYLYSQHSISERSLEDAATGAGQALRGAAQEYWYKVHEKRRSGETSQIGTYVERLVKHDVENTVGVIETRKSTKSAPFGHTAWWLTFDRNAYKFGAALRDALGKDAPKSPALSPDFLTQVLRLGPVRTAVARELRVELSLVTDISRLDLAPPNLVARAESERKAMGDVSPLVIRRQVRDLMDQMRMLSGPIELLHHANGDPTRPQPVG